MEPVEWTCGEGWAEGRIRDRLLVVKEYAPGRFTMEILRGEERTILAAYRRQPVSVADGMAQLTDEVYGQARPLVPSNDPPYMGTFQMEGHTFSFWLKRNERGYFAQYLDEESEMHTVTNSRGETVYAPSPEVIQRAAHRFIWKRRMELPNPPSTIL